jgi:hypothetical protein
MSTKTFQDLVELMARLRAPDGCPWDREQSYATLAPMLIEEAYEVIEAAEAQDWAICSFKLSFTGRLPRMKRISTFTIPSRACTKR